MAAARRKILLPLPPRKNKQLTETIPATDNTQISIANITKLQLDIRQHEQKISENRTATAIQCISLHPLLPHRYRSSLHFRRLVTFHNR
jgi:hypothetical protein